MPLILLNSPLINCSFANLKIPLLDRKLPTPTSLKSSFLLNICKKEEV